MVHLNLNEDHIRLVSFLNIDNDDDRYLRLDRKVMLSVQSHILDDVAMVLGLRDTAIEGTENDEDGSAYPDDVEQRMLDAYHYVSDNLYYIESLLHQRCTEGIQPGEYVARESDLIWEKKS